MVEAPMQAPVKPHLIAKRLLAMLNAMEATPANGPDKDPETLRLLDAACQVPSLASHMVDAVLAAAVASGSAAGLAIQAYRDDPAWSRHYPLQEQAFSPLFKTGPALHLNLFTAIAQSDWPRAELEQLRRAVTRGDDVAHAARVLRRDGETIVSEAVALTQKTQEIRSLKKRCSMHVVQIEAWFAALQSAGSVRGKRCIDLGSGAGELVTWLHSEGAQVQGSELTPESEFLFGVSQEPRFDIVFASALMEPGAFSWPEFGVDPPTYHARCDELVEAAAAMLVPGGYLVVRNLNHPIPFSKEALERIGLHLMPSVLPLCTPAFGGRLAVWRKI